MIWKYGKTLWSQKQHFIISLCLLQLHQQVFQRISRILQLRHLKFPFRNTTAIRRTTSRSLHQKSFDLWAATTSPWITCNGSALQAESRRKVRETDHEERIPWPHTPYWAPKVGAYVVVSTHLQIMIHKHLISTGDKLFFWKPNSGYRWRQAQSNSNTCWWARTGLRR